MLRPCGTFLMSCAAVALVFSAAAAAQTKTGAAEAQKRYQEERAFCLSGKSAQDQKTCLREAGAALQDARSGKLDEGQAFERNQLARCDYLKGEDRDLCVRRMGGEGKVSGSVEGGGIYRELTVTEPVSETSGGKAR